jgi:hypothetical protein
MDELICDFPKVTKWISKHNGDSDNNVYSSALIRSTSVYFAGTFSEAIEFLSLEGVRRALIAYWSEALIGLKERNVQSSYARHHNWNAIAEIYSRLSLKP